MFKWEAPQEETFVTLRDALCKELILQYPDYTKEFNVTTDASGYAIGGVLSQGEIGKDLPIAYCSRLLNTAERNYSTIERELLAIVYAVHYFRPYLYGREFVLVTDHSPLVWLKSHKDPTSRLTKWTLKLAEYNNRIVYKARTDNANADASSRNSPGTAHVLPLSLDDSISSGSLYSRESRTNDQDLIELNNLSKGIGLGKDKSEQTHREQELPSTLESFYNCSDISGVYCETKGIDASNSPVLDRSDSDSDSENPFEPAPQPYRRQNQEEQAFKISQNMIEVRNRLTMRKDNLAIFITMKGNPIDEGAKQLQSMSKLHHYKDLTLGRAKVTKFGTKSLISLVVKENLNIVLDEEILNDALESLLSVARELGLQTISISKSNKLDDVV